MTPRATPAGAGATQPGAAESKGVESEPASADDPAPSWHYWLGVPVMIYAATRAAQIPAIAGLKPAGTSLDQKLLAWDAGWFIRVAQDGYPPAYTYDATGHLTANALAFFPLYPWLIRAGHTVGLSYGAAALAVSWLAGAIAAVVIYLLADRLWGRRAVGYALVVLFCAQPMSVVLSMGYSESVFTALAAGTLLAAYHRWWLVAGLLGALAGLTRPTAAAVAIALVVAVAVRIGRPAGAPPRRAEVVRAVAGSLIALAATPAYIAWVGLRVGDLRGWFRIQAAGWGTRFDFGRSVWDLTWGVLRSDGGWIETSVALMLIAATVALVVALRRRVWPPLAVYGVISFVLVIGQAGYFHSKPRLLVPVLLILVPAALAAARAKPKSASLWLIAYAAFGIWYGAYMITIWPYAI